MIKNYIYINNTYRPDINLIKINITSGLTNPSTVIISVPTDKIARCQLNRWVPIEIYFDTRRNYYNKKHPIFIGYVWEKVISEEPGSRETKFQCVGSEILLITNEVGKNYNVFQSYDNTIYTTVDIVNDIINTYNTDNVRGITFDTRYLSASTEKHNIKGTPISTALENLVAAEATIEKARIKKTYYNVTDNPLWKWGDIHFSIYGKNIGKKAKIRIATDPTKSILNQPTGRPNISSISEETQVGSFVNRWIIEGKRKISLRSMRLIPDWGTNLENNIKIFENYYLYTTPIIEDKANPYYQKGNEDIGRKWRIAPIPILKNNSYINSYQPEIAVNYKYRDQYFPQYVAAENERIIAPFVFGQVKQSIENMEYAYANNYGTVTPNTYQYTGYGDNYYGGYFYSGKFNLINVNFKIQGMHVIFNFPVHSSYIDPVSEKSFFTFPEELYLVCAVVEGDHITYDSGKIGNESYTVTRTVRSDEFECINYYKSFYWTTDNEGKEIIDWVDSFEVRNDYIYMWQQAQYAANNNKNSDSVYSFALENMPSYYDIGYQLDSNYIDLAGKNISNIEYSCDVNQGESSFHTIIQVEG